MIEDFLDFQQSCTLTDIELCNKCSFFLNCERKYELKNDTTEYYSILPNSIVLFSSEDTWTEFTHIYGFTPIMTDTYKHILDISNKSDLEIIIYN